MKELFIAATLFCGVLALLTGRAEALGAEMMAAGDAAVELGLTLCGAYMIWCGLLRVIEGGRTGRSWRTGYPARCGC